VRGRDEHIAVRVMLGSARPTRAVYNQVASQAVAGASPFHPARPAREAGLAFGDAKELAGPRARVEMLRSTAHALLS